MCGCLRQGDTYLDSVGIAAARQASTGGFAVEHVTHKQGEEQHPEAFQPVAVLRQHAPENQRAVKAVILYFSYLH
jgi:hypothetical protein